MKEYIFFIFHFIFMTICYTGENFMNTYKKTLIFSLATCMVFFLVAGVQKTHAALLEENIELGVNNTFSAGSIQKVPAGFALTAIGYGSDDWKCVVGIKTAKVNADGTVDFAQTDTSWQTVTCAGGAPQGDHVGNQKSFEPIDGYVITGWSWGADTSGGVGSVPGGDDADDSFPDDECFYQEYTNLSTKEIFAFGAANTGTCQSRGYGLSDLKAIVHAPAGRVIVGIQFNIDNDANLDFLAITNRQVVETPPIVPPSPPTTCELFANSMTGTVTIHPGDSVVWTATSTPNAQQFFWYVSGLSTQNHTGGDVTPRTDTYTYNDTGSYQVYFVVENPLGTVKCTSNTITLNVVPPTTTPASPSCSLVWDAPVDASGRGLRSVGDMDNLTLSVSGLSANQPFIWRNTHTSGYTREAGMVADNAGNVNVHDSTLITDADYGGIHAGSYVNQIFTPANVLLANCGGFVIAATTGSTDLPPVITVLPPNPATVTIGQTYTDAGATANDPEEGNITSRIITNTSAVNTAVVGSYQVTYTVSDSQGHTVSASRTVNVVPASGGGGGTPATGSVTFCIMFADENNVIATTSSMLPGGSFSLNLATSTNFASSTIQTKTWLSSTFAPNRKIILGSNDADCVTYSNLALGSYYYSQLAVSGSSLWLAPKYNDMNTQSVNNIFDFFAYSLELFNATTTDDASRNLNSDGQIILAAGNLNQTLVMLQKDDHGLGCPAPQITSSLTATGTNGQPFMYTLTASSTSPVTFSVGTLPAGLSFSTTTHTIAGTPTVAGVFSIPLTVLNDCAGGVTLQTLILNINPIPAPPGGGGGGGGGGCTSGCGGGGGGPIYPNQLTIFNEQVLETVPRIAMVTWNTNLPATRRVLYDTVSHQNVLNTGDPTSNYGYKYSTELVATPLLTAHGMVVAIQPGITYYFREISTDVSGGFTRVAIGKEVVLNPGQGTVNPPINGCRLLYDYMRKDLNNNPTEVTKLQIFLKDIEGFSTLAITGVYDDATVAAVNAFQVRYGNDILAPWGYAPTDPTGYEYILTQKKINEIYCKIAFPLTPLQQQEIDNYRHFLQSLQNAGIANPAENQFIPSVSTTTPPVIIDNDIVGIATTTPEVPSLASRMFANVLSGFGLFGDQCPSGFCGWLSLLLVLIIIVLSYYLYKERQNNKKLEAINKEINLR